MPYGILTHRDRKLYKMATAFELAWPYGLPRVMSSYSIIGSTDAGPPSSGGEKTNDVDCDSSDSVCEHQWREISSMVKFHNAVMNDNVEHWWDNEYHPIAFGRGNKGFIVINNEDFPLSKTVNTSLPAGQYCDVITSDSNKPPCSGRSVVVGSDGAASITVPNDDNPVIAIHVQRKLTLYLNGLDYQ